MPVSLSLTDALGHALADKRIDILRQIGTCGSISQAARAVGVSYKAAWQAVDTLTNLAGTPLVARAVGGAGGGGAQLTEAGHQLLAAADAMAQARGAVLSRWQATPHAGPALARLAVRTSMRNQLPCEVLGCEPASPDDPTVLIRLRTAGGALLASSVTRESADLLALRPGAGVLALCKATAVRVSAGQPAAHPVTNQLRGRIDRIARGQGRDEVVLSLDGGGQWVGFAHHPFTARRGQWACAAMPAEALVVGVT